MFKVSSFLLNLLLLMILVEVGYVSIELLCICMQICCPTEFFVKLTQARTIREEKPQLGKCLHQIAYRQVCGEFS